jgi:competence protein ComGC
MKLAQCIQELECGRPQPQQSPPELSAGENSASLLQRRFPRPRTDALRWRQQLAFTLIEVMIALMIFFMCTFAILGLTSQLLQNARVFQTKKIPPVSLVHAWYTSKTNRVTEGEQSGSFSDISTDLGDLYRDYEYVIITESDPEMTNGLWDVTYRVLNRRKGGQVESEIFTLYWDPNSQSRSAQGMGGTRP